MQDVFLFSDTVEENVRFGKRGEVLREEVVASLDCAEAKNFVERMESRYDTLIGERRGRAFRWSETENQHCPGDCKTCADPRIR